MSSNVNNFENIGSAKLMSDSVSEILKHENYERYRNWLQVKLPEYVGDGMLPLEAPQALHALATILSRAVWNAVPLPGNGFRPSPLPTPGRNDPCPCGSGAKYKKCCASLPAPPPLHVQTLWPLVLEKLPRETVQQRLATIRMDQGDRSGAWDAFQKARNDDPDNPIIGVLEVHLLVAEKRADEARERSSWSSACENSATKTMKGIWSS